MSYHSHLFAGFVQVYTPVFPDCYKQPAKIQRKIAGCSFYQYGESGLLVFLVGLSDYKIADPGSGSGIESAM